MVLFCSFILASQPLRRVKTDTALFSWYPLKINKKQTDLLHPLEELDYKFPFAFRVILLIPMFPTIAHPTDLFDSYPFTLNWQNLNSVQLESIEFSIQISRRIEYYLFELWIFRGIIIYVISFPNSATYVQQWLLSRLSLQRSISLSTRFQFCPISLKSVVLRSPYVKFHKRIVDSPFSLLFFCNYH